LNEGRKQKVLQAIGYLFGLLIAIRFELILGPSEYSGGRITRHLFTLLQAGEGMFLLAFVLAFFIPRIATVIGLAAGLLCLPVYGLIIAPGPFQFALRRLFGDEWSSPQQLWSFRWDSWTVLGLLTVGITVFFFMQRVALKRPALSR
jgi:hypothetical protein